MTYGELKILAKSLLSSDYPLPDEDSSIKALLGMAYRYLANKCQVLNLHTLDKSADILRLGRGEYLVRNPVLPTSDDEELDIDEELGDAAASLLASYVSEKKAGIHQGRADNIIRDYNAKVDELMETWKKES